MKYFTGRSRFSASFFNDKRSAETGNQAKSPTATIMKYGPTPFLKLLVLNAPKLDFIWPVIYQIKTG